MKITIKEQYPVMDFRSQAASLVKDVKRLAEASCETITVDCSGGIVFSRSAMDEIYKSLLDPKSPLSGRVSLTGVDEDFQKKLRAVKRSQNLKKTRVKLPDEDVLDFSSAIELKEFVTSLRN